jgi:hypothetical protein
MCRGKQRVSSCGCGVCARAQLCRRQHVATTRTRTSTTSTRKSQKNRPHLVEDLVNDL